MKIIILLYLIWNEKKRKNIRKKIKWIIKNHTKMVLDAWTVQTVCLKHLT